MSTLYAVLFLMLLGLLCGALLVWLTERLEARHKQSQSSSLVDEINNILPQTQCGQCGYAGCKPYAIAIEQGENINKCPPGGATCVQSLANLLGIEPLPLDASLTAQDAHIAKVAFIDEAECIGCTKCIQACPVDAILGAPKFMHTVLENECTGCDLCVAPCPVDCIEMQEKPLVEHLFNWQSQHTNVIVTDNMPKAS